MELISVNGQQLTDNQAKLAFNCIAESFKRNEIALWINGYDTTRMDDAIPKTIFESIHKNNDQYPVMVSLLTILDNPGISSRGSNGEVVGAAHWQLRDYLKGDRSCEKVSMDEPMINPREELFKERYKLFSAKVHYGTVNVLSHMEGYRDPMVIIDRMGVLIPKRRYGSKLMEHILESSKADLLGLTCSISTIACLEEFYEKFGFKTRHRFFISDTDIENLNSIVDKMDTEEQAKLRVGEGYLEVLLMFR